MRLILIKSGMRQRVLTLTVPGRVFPFVGTVHREKQLLHRLSTKKPIFLSRFMVSIFLLWFVQTSVMPLFVGAVTGALAAWVGGSGCATGWWRRAIRAGAAAWTAHLALVGSGLVREGSTIDYAAVILISALSSAMHCGRRSNRTEKTS